MVCGDGRQGYKECAPYDVINVGAYSDQIPQAFVEQLKVGGILCMPATLSDGHQYMMKLTKKSDGSFKEERGLGVKYVPLTSKEA